jgi:hypothetical protein
MIAMAMLWTLRARLDGKMWRKEGKGKEENAAYSSVVYSICVWGGTCHDLAYAIYPIVDVPAISSQRGLMSVLQRSSFTIFKKLCYSPD